jgi:hypothetical protein
MSKVKRRLSSRKDWDLYTKTQQWRLIAEELVREVQKYQKQIRKIKNGG